MSLKFWMSASQFTWKASNGKLDASTEWQTFFYSALKDIKRWKGKRYVVKSFYIRLKASKSNCFERLSDYSWWKVSIECSSCVSSWVFNRVKFKVLMTTFLSFWEESNILFYLNIAVIISAPKGFLDCSIHQTSSNSVILPNLVTKKFFKVAVFFLFSDKFHLFRNSSFLNPIYVIQKSRHEISCTQSIWILVRSVINCKLDSERPTIASENFHTKNSLPAVIPFLNTL